MKSILSLCLLFILLTHTGCTSYSFRGAHSLSPKLIIKNKEKYQLRFFNSNIFKERYYVWSIIPDSGTLPGIRELSKIFLKLNIEEELFKMHSDKFVKSDLLKELVKKNNEEELVKKYRDKFDIANKDNKNNNILFDVEINCAPTIFEYDFLSLTLFPLTLFTYPLHVELKDCCEILVSINDNIKRGRVEFNTNSWLSVYSPFGLYGKVETDQYNGHHTFGSGILQAPHLSEECHNKKKYVFVSEIAKEISTCITKFEDDIVLQKD